MPTAVHAPGKVLAERVASLPLRNAQGIYDRHQTPDLSSSAEITDFVQARGAVWNQPVERNRLRSQSDLGAPSAPRLKAARKTKRTG